MIRATLLSLIVLSAACNGSPVGPGHPQQCTQIGCASGFFYEVPLMLDDAQVQTSTLEICRNGRCTKASLSTLQLPQNAGRTSLVTFPDPEVDAELERVPTGFVLGVEYAGTDAELHDGDTYDVTLFAPDGTTLVAVRKSGDYKLSLPNGPGCPPACRTLITS